MPSLRILTSRSARTLAGVLFVIGAATLPGQTPSTADHTPPAIATAATPRAPDAEFPLQVSVGLCEDYPEETRTVEAAEADLKRVRNAGGKVLRIAFGWDAMEPKRGEFDWSFWDEVVPLAVEKYGIRLIPYICYTPLWAASEKGPADFWRSPPRDVADFERFVAVLSARYARWIDSWELWNEPDNAAYWTGDAQQFAALLRAGSRGIRRGDPGATIVLGGIAHRLEFLEELFERHRIAPAVDVVNLHSYYETWHPDPIETLPDYIAAAADIVARHGEKEPLWMAEVGYSTRSGNAQVSSVYRARFTDEHTPPYQAAALARTWLLCLGTGRLPLIAWYRINDLPPAEVVIGDDNNRHLGLFDAQGRAKPSLDIFQWFARQFAQPYRLAGDSAAATTNPKLDLETRTFAFPQGRFLVAAWLSPPGGPTPSQPAPDQRTTTVRLTLYAPAVRLTDIVYAPRRSPSPVADRAVNGASARLFEFPLHGGEVALLVFESGTPAH